MRISPYLPDFLSLHHLFICKPIDYEHEKGIQTEDEGSPAGSSGQDFSIPEGAGEITGTPGQHIQGATG